MLGLREELNFLSHSFSHPYNSFSPPPDTSGLHHPSTKPVAKIKREDKKAQKSAQPSTEGTCACKRAQSTRERRGGSAEMPGAITQLVVIWLTQLRLKDGSFISSSSCCTHLLFVRVAVCGSWPSSFYATGILTFFFTDEKQSGWQIPMEGLVNKIITLCNCLVSRKLFH